MTMKKLDGANEEYDDVMRDDVEWYERRCGTSRKESGCAPLKGGMTLTTPAFFVPGLSSENLQCDEM